MSSHKKLSKKPMKSDSDNEILKPVDFYQIEAMKPYLGGGSLEYKMKDKINLKMPMRAVITGASGTKKTNTAINIFRYANCFHKVYLFCANKDQPLYNYMTDRIRAAAKNCDVPESEMLVVSNDLSNLPNLDTDINTSIHNLIIVDDFMNAKKKLSLVYDFFSRGRSKNVSIIFITQSFFRTPQEIRSCTDYIFFKRVNSIRDLERIINEYYHGFTNEILDFYNESVGESDNNFILFDLTASNINKAIRKNFNEGYLTLSKPFVKPTSKSSKKKKVVKVIEPQKDNLDESSDIED